MKRAFLDASVLFSGIHSPTGAARELFKWHLRHKIELVVSDYVIQECLKNLGESYPHRVGAVELLLDFLQADVAEPSIEEVRIAASYTVLKDAPVVAAAIAGHCSYLLTFNRKDLIDPPEVGKQSRLIIVTPGDLLRALREDNS
ncbi:MAG: PIN domain-containing protein [Chloroflexota bacterium]